MDLGRAAADEDGRGTAVRTVLEPRLEGEMVESASFDGNNRNLASSVSKTIEVLAGPPPVEQEAGIRPGINVSMLVAILGTVWRTHLTAMGLLMRMARHGSLAAPGTEECRG